GILLHGIPHAHDFVHGAELFIHKVGYIGGSLAAITPTVLSGVFGVLAGAIALAGVAALSRIRTG
ncbi:MAG: DUF808 domain-containing protein, partial [Thiothrix sp.]